MFVNQTSFAQYEMPWIKIDNRNKCCLGIMTKYIFTVFFVVVFLHRPNCKKYFVVRTHVTQRSNICTRYKNMECTRTRSQNRRCSCSYNLKTRLVSQHTTCHFIRLTILFFGINAQCNIERSEKKNEFSKPKGHSILVFWTPATGKETINISLSLKDTNTTIFRRFFHSGC